MVSRLIHLAVNRPWRVLSAWGTFVVVFAIIGLPVQKHLLPATLFIPGTESFEWKELKEPNYGESIALVLNGPASALDAQGPGLSEALSKRDGTRAISPWSPGAGETAKILRPTPGEAFIALDVKIPEGKTVSDIVDPLEEFIAERTRPPLETHLSGDAPLGKELNEAAFEAMHKAEIIAAPLLVLVLLGVFRSPIAAAIPLVIAGGTVAAAFGILRLSTNVLDVDITALSLCSMIGLALGVDYALLLVSRFREALDDGMGPKQAASLAANTAGRTAIFAGTILGALMLTQMAFSPGTLLRSSSLGAIFATVLAVVGGLLVCPAALSILGTRVNKWQIGGAPKKESGLIGRVVGGTAARPALAALIVGGGLLVMAAPTLALKTIPPDPKVLPLGNEGRDNYEAVRHAGFGPNYNVALREADGGAITDPDRLVEIRAFEERLRKVRYVSLVTGPGAIADQTAALRNAPQAIRKAKRQLRAAEDELTRRTRQVDDARAMAAEQKVALDRGLGQAQALLDRGKQALANVEKQFGGGFDDLVAGMAAARDGTRQLRDGTKLLKRKAAQLATALAAIRDGVRDLQPQVEQAGKQVAAAQAALSLLRLPAQVTERELANAWAALGKVTAGNADPAVQETRLHVAAAYAAATGRDPITGVAPFRDYQGLDDALARAADASGQAADQADEAIRQAKIAADVTLRIADGASRLVDPGLATILRGLRELAAGLSEAHDRIAAAAPEVARLQREAVDQLNTGQQFLDRTRAQAGPTLEVVQGQLEEASGRLHTVRDDLVGRTGPFAPLRTVDDLERNSPFFFQSPYVVVAGLQGAEPITRRTAETLVDSSTGGDVGQIVVLADVPTNDPKQDEVVRNVRKLTDEFEEDTGMTAAVGGSAPELLDYSVEMGKRVPLLIIALIVITYAMLVPVLRSLVLPAIAIALNLLVVAVAVAVVTILFVEGVVATPAPLGGAGAPDVVGITGVFCIVFALSIDYYVFLLTRMREEYVRTQDNEQAVMFGIERTAKVVTGAAAIMLGVFFAFSLADFVPIREVGVGLTTAIFIDATVVRLVLLPALMRLFGDFTWWMPNWLDERLPLIDVEGSAFEHEAQQMNPAHA